MAGTTRASLIVFGRHGEGIPYGAIDAQPAQLFFLLVTTTVTQHLALLARTSRLVRDPKMRQNLLTADRPEKIITLIREAEIQL